MAVPALTMEELLALPASVGIETAGKALGIGHSTALKLAKTGEFPCRVVLIGCSYKVPQASLFEAMGITDTVAADEIARLWARVQELQELLGISDRAARRQWSCSASRSLGGRCCRGDRSAWPGPADPPTAV
jgi:hypothetical protein